MDDRLSCPACKSPALSEGESAVVCTGCGVSYAIRDGVVVFLRPDSPVLQAEADRAEFWNAGWANRNSHLLSLDRAGVLAERDRVHRELTAERYPSVVDISNAVVGGKSFLNIGCGGGYEGLLFAGYGTRYIGVDLSYNAARYTSEVVRKAGFDGVAYQAEAEKLPLRDDSMDYIYSSGVLHHTPNTLVTLQEAFRVLKPGGTAMIGLYATHSVMFLWYRLHAVLRGNFTPDAIAEWMHANTEGAWVTEGRRNKWTSTYTRRQMHDLLAKAGFSDIRLQQSAQQVKDLPIIGKLSRLLPKAVQEAAVPGIGGILMATCTKR